MTKSYSAWCNKIGIGMPPVVWGGSGVYSISCRASGKMYIGCSTNILVRLAHHTNVLRKNKHCNRKLQNAWNKYGSENFFADVIQYCDDIYDEERFWIEQFDSFGEGFNLTCGGDGIFIADKESLKIGREKASAKLRTEEARKRVSEWSSEFHANNKEKMKAILSDNATSGWSKLSTEERTARAMKVWETRRRNKEVSLG